MLQYIHTTESSKDRAKPGHRSPSALTKTLVNNRFQWYNSCADICLDSVPGFSVDGSLAHSAYAKGVEGPGEVCGHASQPETELVTSQFYFW